MSSSAASEQLAWLSTSKHRAGRAIGSNHDLCPRGLSGGAPGDAEQKNDHSGDEASIALACRRDGRERLARVG